MEVGGVPVRGAEDEDVEAEAGWLDEDAGHGGVVAVGEVGGPDGAVEGGDEGGEGDGGGVGDGGVGEVGGAEGGEGEGGEGFGEEGGDGGEEGVGGGGGGCAVGHFLEGVWGPDGLGLLGEKDLWGS